MMISHRHAFFHGGGQVNLVGADAERADGNETVGGG
jgi:hypothetical protein